MLVMRKLQEQLVVELESELKAIALPENLSGEAIYEMAASMSKAVFLLVHNDLNTELSNLRVRLIG